MYAGGNYPTLHRCNIKAEGAECVIVGRSNIVGKPMAILMLGENATVTVCHSKDKKFENDMPQSGYINMCDWQTKVFYKGLRQRGRGCD